MGLLSYFRDVSVFLSLISGWNPTFLLRSVLTYCGDMHDSLMDDAIFIHNVV